MHKLIPLLVVIALAGCGAERPQAPRSAAPRPIAAPHADCHDAAFAGRMYAQLARAKQTFAFSPYSIAAALAMTNAGARGATRAQLDALLPCATPPREQSRGSTKLEVANAIWGQTGTPFRPAFLARLAHDFDAPLRQIDFVAGPDAAAQRIDDWVAARTHGKIDAILGPGALSIATRLVLVNAIYLKAEWAQPFDAKDTLPDTFHGSGGSERVPFMHSQRLTAFARHSDSSTVELPYADGTLALDVILPDAGHLDDVERAVAGGRLGSLRAGLSDTLVDLSLPKLDIASEFDLASALDALGVHDLFTPAADLSGMAGGDPLFVSRAMHRATITVDEKGTEAAAVTAVVGAAGASMNPGPQPIEVTVDRPFILAIRDLQTHATLFLARILNVPR